MRQKHFLSTISFLRHHFLPCTVDSVCLRARRLWRRRVNIAQKNECQSLALLSLRHHPQAGFLSNSCLREGSTNSTAGEPERGRGSEREGGRAREREGESERERGSEREGGGARGRGSEREGGRARERGGARGRRGGARRERGRGGERGGGARERGTVKRRTGHSMKPEEMMQRDKRKLWEDPEETLRIRAKGHERPGHSQTFKE